MPISTKKISFALKLLEARLRRRPVPLLVNWILSNRCNYQCRYCNLWKKNTPEPETGTITTIIDKLYECGTRMISFSGGEPLIRDDIGTIIKHCAGKGIYTKITTNGSLIGKKIDEIAGVDLVKITFNGPRHIHDAERAEGSYDDVIRAIPLLKEYSIDAGLNCVLTRQNMNHLDEIFNTVEKLKTKISFQPLEYRDGSNEYINAAIPAPREFKKAIALVMKTKKEKKHIIANSNHGLRYLYNWPRHTRIQCWAGKLYYRITAEGILTACDRLTDHTSFKLTPDSNIKQIIKEIPPVNCEEQCWRNTTIELNYLLSLTPGSMLNWKNISCRDDS
ncbi:MAG: radical SAM protein [bacterium]|nr:radical SAM protein [bacterium]